MGCIMKWCNQCHIEVAESEPVCPLCRTVPQSDGTEGNQVLLYPQIVFDVHKYHIFIRLFMFISVVTGVVLLAVNLMNYHGFFWSGIVIAVILYAIITLGYSIQRNANPAAKIMVQTLAAELLVVWIDYLIGYEGWSVNYAVPGILLVAECSMLVL